LSDIGRPNLRSALAVSFLFCLAVTLFPGTAVAAAAAAGAAKDDEVDGDCPGPSRWFYFLAAANVHPGLASEELIEDYFNEPAHWFAPGFDDVRTVGDLRDEFLLWTPYIGIGRVMGKHWSLFLQGGYSAGTVRTKAKDRSRILLPLYTDFSLRRGALYGGGGLNFYPFGLTDRAGETGLKGAKPFIGTRLMWTEATYDVKLKIGLWPVKDLIRVNVSDRWLLPSVSTNVGLNVPLTERSELELNIGHSFFFDQESDFEGAVFTVQYNRFFK